MRKRYKGGTNTSRTTVAPVLSYPLQDGTTSQRSSAMATGSNMNAKQQSLIDQHGGGHTCPYCNRAFTKPSTRRKRSTSIKKRRRKTFSRGGNTITVPSFPSSTVSPTNATTISSASNSANLQSGADASGDCFATGTCPK